MACMLRMLSAEAMQSRMYRDVPEMMEKQCDSERWSLCPTGVLSTATSDQTTAHIAHAHTAHIAHAHGTR